MADIETTKCAAMGCTKAVSADFLMCRRHWRMVDKVLQEEIWEAHHTRDRAQHLMLVSRAAEVVRRRELETGRRCRSCDAPIFYALSTANQRPMPIDTMPVENGNVIVRQGKLTTKLYAKVDTAKANDGEERFTSHFATCPQANEWRRDRAEQEAAAKQRAEEVPGT